jgi:YHS domain-containing protein
LRFLIQFVALLILFAIARTVISWVTRLFVQSMPQNAQPDQDAASQRADNGSLQSAGELQKDPVCGTFVPVSSNWKRTVNGRPVYFCSAECRDKYLVPAGA